MFVAIQEFFSNLLHSAFRSCIRLSGLLQALLLLPPILRKEGNTLPQLETVQSSDQCREEVPISSTSKPVCPQEPELRPLAHRILDILDEYCLPVTSGQCQPLRCVEKFVGQVERFIIADEPIHMVLPAFPFKSANKVTKVLGPLPDKGEEEALRLLDGLCEEIRQIYSAGARICIVSDGLVYNDILSVPDSEVWQYSCALRQLARSSDCENLQFARLCDLVGNDTFPEPISEDAYVEAASKIRDEIMTQFTLPDFDVIDAIAHDPDVSATYCGYAKFLSVELAEVLKAMDVPNTQKRRYCKDVAQRMIYRGRAYAAAITSRYPTFLRLSIHPSMNTEKISVILIRQKGALNMTPWHSAVVRAADGSITMQHAQTVSRATHELMWEGGRPSYFRERTDHIEIATEREAPQQLL